MQWLQQNDLTGGAQEKRSAFEAEALPHSKDLYRAAVRMLQSPSRASDAVQETYLLAWKSFHSYQPGTNCRAWMFRILFNVIRHERRQWFKWMTNAEDDLASTQIPAQQPVSDTLTDADILRALDELPAQYRQVVLLVDVEEFAYKEVSEILDIPIGTVMSRLSRARALLRARLKETAQSYGIVSPSCVLMESHG